LLFIINRNKGYKRKRLQPNSLSSFVLSTPTSAQYNISAELEESKEDYFRFHAYFPILDCIIENMNKRFSSESLEMAISIDNFFKLDFELSSYFIDHYKVNIVITFHKNYVLYIG